MIMYSRPVQWERILKMEVKDYQTLAYHYCCTSHSTEKYANEKEESIMLCPASEQTGGSYLSREKSRYEGKYCGTGSKSNSVRVRDLSVIVITGWETNHHTVIVCCFFLIESSFLVIVWFLLIESSFLSCSLALKFIHSGIGNRSLRTETSTKC